MKNSLASTLIVVGCTLVIGTAVGAGVAYSVLAATTPETLEQETALATIPVTMQDFDDPRTVELTADILPPANIALARAGTVTALACAPGASLTSGTSSVAVDGSNLLSLSTAVPLWRDLTPGDRGSDVRALEDELVRLGQAANTDGALSRAEMKTLTALAAGVGVEVGSTLPRDLVLWLPAPVVTVDECRQQLGASVAAGDVLATADSGIALSPLALPADLLPGTRLLDLLPEPVVLGEAGELPPEVTSAAVRSSDAFREAVSAAPEASSLVLTATLTLQTPVPVAAVPATAVLVDSDGSPCVFVDREPVAVTVVGSEFGNSFVVFSSGDAPRSVDAAVPEEGSSCT